MVLSCPLAEKIRNIEGTLMKKRSKLIGALIFLIVLAGGSLIAYLDTPHSPSSTTWNTTIANNQTKIQSTSTYPIYDCDISLGQTSASCSFANYPVTTSTQSYNCILTTVIQTFEVCHATVTVQISTYWENSTVTVVQAIPTYPTGFNQCSIPDECTMSVGPVVTVTTSK